MDDTALWERARQRFESRVERTDGCWLWTGDFNPQGYGIFNVRKKTKNAHRWAWLLFVGPIEPEELEVDHACRNKRCVRLDHLRLLTGQENRAGRVWSTPASCPKGHPYTPENSARRKNGALFCRECSRIRAERNRRARGVPTRPAIVALSESDKELIRCRAARGASQRSLAAEFRVSQVTVSRVVRGRR